MSNVGGAGAGGATIQAQARLGSGGLAVTLSNNTAANSRNFVAAIRMRANDGNTVCANVTGNSAAGNGSNLGGGAGSLGGAFEVVVNDASSGNAATSVLFEGFAGDPVTTWSANGNSGSPVSWLLDGGTLGAPSAACATPTNPIP